MADDDKISIVTLTDEPDAGGERILGSGFKQRVDQIEVDVFAKEMNSFLKKLDKVLKEQPESIGNGFCMDEIQLNIQINAYGEIKLIGTLHAGIQSSMTLTLRKK